MINNPPSLSLCMIVKNEQHNLRQSLSAVVDLVDEIIIVDTGSTDKTTEIAKEFNTKIFHFVWNDDFASARNFALQQATCDWVLNLDADHIFNCQNPSVLKQALYNSCLLGLMIKVRTHNSSGDFHDLDRLLLFKNHCGFNFSGFIFEHPLKSIKEYAQKNKFAQPFGALEDCRIDHFRNSNLKDISKIQLPVLQKAVKNEPDNFDYRFKLLLALKELLLKDQYKNELLHSVYRIEQNDPLLNESIVAIWGLFGEWVIEDNNSDDVEKFYKNAKSFTEKSKWNDIRLVWPYVKVSIMQRDFDNAISDLKKCIQNGIAPDNVYLNESEYIAPIFQLIRLINKQKPASEFIACINEMPELTKNTNVDEHQVFRFIKKQDPRLFNEISNVLGEEQKCNLAVNFSDQKAPMDAETSQPLISLCMIVKNEQDNLERCLKSVKDVVDEIVIVDTGSTDKSIEIAQKYKSKIIYTIWHNDFSDARNLALDQASGKWILHLDADEELHDSSINQIRPKLERSKADGIGVILRNHQPKDDLIPFLDESQVRIFLNKTNYRFRNKVHEQIVPAIAENAGKFEESDIIINHYGYQANNEQRVQRNLNMLKDELQESPQDAYLLFKMGETYKALKQWDKAAEFLTKAISNPQGNITNEIKEIIYLRLGQIELAKDNHKAAQEYASACLRFNGQNAMAKYILGVSLMYSNQIENGVKLFQELKDTQHIHGLDLSEIDTLLEVFKNAPTEEKVLN